MSTAIDKAWERFKTNMAPLCVEPASSELAPPEPAGPAKVVDAVATGSLPVSSAEALCLEWEKHAEASELAATNKEAIGMNSAAKQIRKYAEIYRRHSNQLRRLAGLPILRQPEENHTISHTQK